MESDCHHCGWHGEATKLNWMIRDHDPEVGGERVCPACRSSEIVLTA